MITITEYAESIIALVPIAQSGTGGSRSAAQVLLSAYNGGEWHLNVTDLCNLDTTNLKHALNVIEGRATLMREPHNMITDGDKIFRSLCLDWRRINNDHRFLSICDECNGTDQNYDEDEDDYIIGSKCPAHNCRGGYTLNRHGDLAWSTPK